MVLFTIDSLLSKTSTTTTTTYTPKAAHGYDKETSWVPMGLPQVQTTVELATVDHSVESYEDLDHLYGTSVSSDTQANSHHMFNGLLTFNNFKDLYWCNVLMHFPNATCFLNEDEPSLDLKLVLKPDGMEFDIYEADKLENDIMKEVSRTSVFSCNTYGDDNNTFTDITNIKPLKLADERPLFSKDTKRQMEVVEKYWQTYIKPKDNKNSNFKNKNRKNNQKTSVLF